MKDAPKYLDEVITERFDLWSNRLLTEEATPLLMVGFTTYGRMVVIATEDTPPDHIEGMLRDALDLLKRERRRHRDPR